MEREARSLLKSWEELFQENQWNNPKVSEMLLDLSVVWTRLNEHAPSMQWG